MVILRVKRSMQCAWWSCKVDINYLHFRMSLMAKSTQNTRNILRASWTECLRGARTQRNTNTLCLEIAVHSRSKRRFVIPRSSDTNSFGVVMLKKNCGLRGPIPTYRAT